MKKNLLFLFLSLAGFAHGQQTERLAGSANLSGGIYWNAAERTDAMQTLVSFFTRQGIDIQYNAPGRRSIVLDARTEAAIAGMPDNALNGYSIRITPSEITIRYTSPQAEESAVQRLIEWVHEQASSRRGIVLPGVEIRDWAAASTVEMQMIDPATGWMGGNGVLQAVGYDAPLSTGQPGTCAEVEAERQRLAASGITATAVFNLTGANAPFEAATGHRMLSVEGMRFVRMLLDACFSQTGFSSVTFAVPPGRYREQVREIAARYPHLTDLHFIE